MDSNYFSHKYGKPSLNYKLGISIFESRLVWMNSPFLTGSNNMQVFLRPEGLNAGKRATGDGGYSGQ
jgi:hypothetical protein